MRETKIKGCSCVFPCCFDFGGHCKVLSAGSAGNNINGKKYTLLLENEYLQFYMNNDTTEFKVVNKINGSEWYSSGTDSADAAAPIALTYLNSQGSLADMNVMDD